MTIRECELPPDALLRRFDRDDGYVDCFEVDVLGSIVLGHYVEAFYTTWLFRAERTILSLAGHPSTDAEGASVVAGGQGSRFAAWRNWPAPIWWPGSNLMHGGLGGYG